MGAQQNDDYSIDELRKSISPYVKEHRLDKINFVAGTSALIVLDMQRFFLEPTSHAYLPAVARITENLRKLVDIYHKKSLPVIFTRHALMRTDPKGIMGEWWKDTIYDDDDMSKISPIFQVAPEDEVIRKTRYSGFYGTRLEEILRGKKVDSVVITGVMTHLCCESTARDAFIRDFKVFIIMDGTATQTADLHISSMKTMSAGFAIPVTTEEMLIWLEN